MILSNTLSMKINKINQVCGAEITNIDLKKDLSADQVEEIREHWLNHHVLSFPNQALSDDDLERFTLYREEKILLRSSG